MTDEDWKNAFTDEEALRHRIKIILAGELPEQYKSGSIEQDLFNLFRTVERNAVSWGQRSITGPIYAALGLNDWLQGMTGGRF